MFGKSNGDTPDFFRLEGVFCGLKKKKEKNTWNVSARLSEHLIAIRHLNKFEPARISMYKQSNKQKIIICINNLMFLAK